MKKIIIILLLMNFSILSAQLLPGGGRDAYEDGKNRKNSDSRYFTAIVFKSPNILDEWALEFGVKVGARITKGFSLSIDYYSLITKNLTIDIPGYPENSPIFRLSHFGITPEYSVRLFPMISASGGVFVGLGNSSYSTSANIDVLDDLEGDWFGIIEPVVGLDIFTSPSVSLFINGGWRIATGVDYKNVTDNDLSGPVFILGFKAYLF